MVDISKKNFVKKILNLKDMHNVKIKKTIETYCLFEISSVFRCKWIKIKNDIIIISK